MMGDTIFLSLMAIVTTVFIFLKIYYDETK